MTITRVTAHDGVGGASAAFGGTPTSGNLLLATVIDVTTAVTISGWTQIVATPADGLGDLLMLFAKTSAGNEGTVTPANGAATLQTTVCEYSGNKNPYAQDGTAGGVATASTGTSKASAQITTTDAGSLIFLAALNPGATTNPAWSGGPTLVTALNNTNAGYHGVVGEYVPGTTVSAFSSTYSWTTAQFSCVLIAGFKPVIAALAPRPKVPRNAAVMRAANW